MVKAITFDLDGVYFVNGKSAFIASLVNMGVLESEAKRVFLQSDEMNNQYKLGKLDDDQFWSWAAREWNLNKTPQELIKLLVSGYEVDQEVLNIVKSVRSKGYKTLICSNNFPARINGLQNRFGFLNDFDAWALSYEVGFAKPSSEIFKSLIEKSGVSASEIVFSDDNEANIEAGAKLGINTFYYQGFNDFLDKLTELGVKK